MAVRTVVKRLYRNGQVKYLPEGQAEPDTASSLERDGLIAQDRDCVTVLDADNLRVVCWQLGANEHSRPSRSQGSTRGCSTSSRNTRVASRLPSGRRRPALVPHQDTSSP